ncbi:hypothetical protein ABZ918_33675 [Streptomyces viridosporus]|uniref:hypothetical protein n=1 Tax=Streptomyces viridosporus TaxID=67581 RepID=UPI0034391D52
MLEIASMADDPDGTYGAWLAELGLSEAIERGILAGFEIDVLEIRDPSPVIGESDEMRRGRRLALLQTALLEHAAKWNLKTVMTFHQKVEEVAAFAEKLSQTAADRFPASSIDADFYALEAGWHVPPGRVWSAWLCGDHLVTERREVIRQFANGIDAAGRGCTGRSSPTAACSARASTSPASGESRRCASPTPAALRWRSCRTSAARSGPTRTAPRRSPGSSCPSSSSPARTRRTWSPPPASAPS